MPDIRLPVLPILEIASTPPPGEIPEGVLLTGAPHVWPENQGEDAVVAVLDTGVSPHPDLIPNLLPGRNFTDEHSTDNTNDEHGHGTHVAGTIAANGRIKGVAPQAKILPCKVLTSDGFGSFTWVADALDWLVGAKQAGINVVAANLSLGGAGGSDRLRDAVKRATEAGILVVCAAGNNGDGDASTDEISYPAAYPDSTAVAAVDFTLKAARFSSSNREVDVAGPGVTVFSTWIGGSYVRLSGTSMATPHVTGLAALLARKHYLRFGKWPTEPELYLLLKYGTVDIEPLGVDASTGAGFATLYPRMPSERELKFTIGSKTRLVDGVPSEMDVAPIIVDSRTYLPVRHVVEPLGAQVDWDATTRGVTVRWRGLQA